MRKASAGTLFGLAIMVAIVGLFAIAGSAQAATIKVTTTDDEYGAGMACSLREAVTAANIDAAFGGCPAGSGNDDVRLVGRSSYLRSIDGINEDNNATGDLDIASKMTIGPTSGRAAINALSYDRVIEVLAAGNLTLSRVLLTGASETYPGSLVDGMGIRLTGGKLKTSRVTIAGNSTLGNSANNGGGMVISGGKAVLDRTTIASNEADNVGGGISMYQGNLKIKRSEILANTSGYSGGGLYLGGSPSERDAVKITDSTIAGNASKASGGGMDVSLYGQDGQTDMAKLTNVTISGNSTGGSGGGIYNYVGGVALNSSTVSDNIADSDATGGDDHGGGLAGSIGFSNSIVYGNTDYNPVAPLADCASIGSGGHNVVGDGTGCFAQNSDTTGDPKLKPLSDNGGPTPTQAIGKGSSAIGLAVKKTAPGRDQRGFKRDKHPDSGAFER